MPWHKARLTADGIRQLLAFVLTSTDCQLFETYSRYDTPLRRFTEIRQIEAAFDLGRDPHGNGIAQQLAAWSPAVMPEPTVRRIELAMRGHSHRYVMEGCGLFHLHLGGLHSGSITESKIGSFSERGSFRKCSVSPGPEDVNWDVHRTLASKLRHRLASLADAA